MVSEDIEWFGRVLECTTDIAYFESVFYVYRIRQGSISNSISVKTVSDTSKHIDKREVSDIGSFGKQDLCCNKLIAAYEPVV